MIKKGASTTEPEPFVRTGNGYQCRYNIAQVEREIDGEPVLEWQYDYIQVPIVEIDGDLSRTLAKRVRDARMAAMTVTTAAGKTFDADETSQDRMTRALQTASVTGQTETQWVLADNTVATVSIEEMREALSLAMDAQAAIWFV